MKLPRDLAGRELVTRLQRFGYRRLHQEGSHVIVETDSPRRHRIAVPDHAAIRPGTLNAILRAVAAVQGIPKEMVLRQLIR